MTPLRPRRALVALLLASAAPACASSRPEPTPDRPPLGCIDAPPRPLPVTPARSPEASQLVQRSLELSAAGRYLEARDAAAAAVAADPGSVAAQATLVEAMLAAGDRNEALGRAKALVESRPDEADAYYVLGRVYLAGLQAPRALEAFENAAALRPGDRETILALLAVHAQWPGHEDEVQSLVDALGPDAMEDPFVLHALASQATVSGDWDRAVTLYRAALERAPHSAPTHFNLAILLDARDEYDAARAELEAFIRDAQPGDHRLVTEARRRLEKLPP